MMTPYRRGTSVNTLQRVQNAAARLILCLSRRSHITPALKLGLLYWLPVKFRIIFKVATTTHNIFNQRSPQYLKDLITFSVSGVTRASSTTVISSC